MELACLPSLLTTSLVLLGDLWGEGEEVLVGQSAWWCGAALDVTQSLELL